MDDIFDGINQEDTLKGKYLTFFLGSEIFGIEIRYVTEIVGLETITQMPETSDYIKGVINLRGNVIPVMDVRLRFSKEPKEYDDRTCIIVIDYNGVSNGLIVDSVCEVLTIPEADIAELPGIRTINRNGFVRNIGKINNAVYLLLDCGILLNAG